MIQRALGLQPRNAFIDVIHLGGVKQFMYTDDASYMAMPEACKHYRLTAKDYVQPPSSSGSVVPEVQVRDEASDGRVLMLLLSHYWLLGIDFTVFDVGALYGFEAVYAAQYIRRHHRQHRIVAFEPGVTGSLLANNVELNGVSDVVTVERLAISNFTGPTVMFGQSHHAEGNRIVNRSYNLEDYTFIAHVDSLDHYCERHGIETPGFIVKIDTEGGEPEVLEGMQRILTRSVTTVITEFSPKELEYRTGPTDFLAALSQHGTLCDLGQHGIIAELSEHRPEVIAPKDFARFTATVRSRPYRWSDILLIPHDLPRREDLLQALVAPQAAPSPSMPGAATPCGSVTPPGANPGAPLAP